ncbi:MAG: pilus assembly protein PilP [Gammaproteobacteria bacterium]|nr:pilus assembly protein PilP [Gammaproteobacteria bacterium]
MTSIEQDSMVMLNELHTIVKRSSFVLQLCSVLLLVACSGDQHDDLNTYVDEVKSRKPGRIKGLPEIKPYESFTYDHSVLRDPFSPFVEVEDEQQVVDDGMRPDSNRKREALEQFPLDSLVFVGHLERNGKRWALVSAPDDTVYRVQPGNHLGQNYGEILLISETTIKIKEIIPNGTGGWADREVVLQLTE